MISAGQGPGRRVALVHDWLNQVGGAEYVLEVLVRMFPGAPVYTSIYAPDRMPGGYRAWDIRTSFMQGLPGVARRHQIYLPAYPLAFAHVDLTGYELVLSNKSGFCHGVHTPPGAVHVCYCLAPTRYLWQYETYAQREALGKVANLALRPMLGPLRRWDYAAAQRVDHFIAISREIQDRIRHYYRRESTVIYPPVDIKRFNPIAQPFGDYFLAGGRLIPYKRTDLAVQACSELRLKLLVFGDGRDRQALERLAGPTVTFLGRVSNEELARLYANARAFIFPGVEDFGIAPLEVQAAGRPVIAFAGGGALETVVDGRTGEFFGDQTVESLMQTLAGFDPGTYDPAACRANAEQFGEERFVDELRRFIEKIHQEAVWN
jgi:glycosyltransferase involved in cell wall biosynthesis